ncbi:hypothetical protein B1C78_14655 [Thioalkalivibrio denitrificans]|uniref:Elongation factor EFG domain-containing protein n=1 Tax=Thioalkalivibrio denitrificans TaxID=108003 RepID=A0A1V3NC93_9GAMM|nr:hypothetical protein [Thioalkalivibrio denitrificans]OOG22665.1 hypothetical protein B1C78_14655 [Thioalkalivibrio denitrificans]
MTYVLEQHLLSTPSQAANQIIPIRVLLHDTAGAQINQVQRGFRILAVDEKALQQAVLLLRTVCPMPLSTSEPLIICTTKPVPAEPVMTIIITTPTDYLQPILARLLSRGAVLTTIGYGSGERQLCLSGPLSGVFGCHSELNEISEGRASIDMKFSHYSPLSSAMPVPSTSSHEDTLSIPISAINGANHEDR